MKKKNKRTTPKGNKKNTKQSNLKHEVLDIFANNTGKPMNYKQVASRLGIDDQTGRNMLAKTLHQLKTSGDLREIERGKYKIKRLSKPSVVGVVDMTTSGAAYVVCEGVDKDVYISSRKVRHALHKDTVKVNVTLNSRSGKPEGEIVEVLERAKTKFVGILQADRGFGFLIADDQRMNVDIFIGNDDLNGARDGEKIIVEMTGW
ncbi:MAG: exoribonuclease R, partial [Oceanospirillaceae bacterium]